MGSGGLPTGTVTFLLTDVEGSTRLWEAEPEPMRLAMARHDALAEAVVTDAGGHLLKARGEGDALFCVFGLAVDAVAAAANLQRAFASEPWPTTVPLRVRVAVHAGDAELRDGDYFGPVINRAARLRAIGHGGQTIVTGVVATSTGMALPPGAELVDLGMHRLKDLSEPEHVFGLRLERGESHPPLRSLDWLPTNLPRLRTSFVGRDREVEAVRKAVTEGQLVTLTGAGGTGKTRLAVQTAASFVGERRDGVWLVELAAVSDPTETAAALGSVVGARTDDLPALLAHLETRDLLIVLDNCEHVIEVAAEVVDLVLGRCRNVTILATSREPLGIPGETVIRLPTLSDDDARELLRDRMGVDAPAAEVERLCRAVDGIPLAIELAAARAATLGLATVVDRLDELFITRRGGTRGAQSRQRTLEAAVGWSHDLLTVDQQRAFRRLSVFVGGFDLAAADAVAGDGTGDGAGDGADVFGDVVALVDQSLVEPVGDGRYRLLEPLRHYGADRLADVGETEVVRDRHLDWALGLVVRASKHLMRRGPGAGAALAADLDNIAGAFQWAMARNRVSDAVTIAIDLSCVNDHKVGGPVSMLRQILDTDLAPVVRVIVEQRLSMALSPVRRSDDSPPLGAVDGLPVRWVLWYDRARAVSAPPQRALEVVSEADRLAAHEEFEGFRALLALSRARVFGDLDDHSSCVAALDQAEEWSRSLGSPVLLVHVLWSRAYEHWRIGEYEQAERVAHQRLAMARELEIPSLLVTSINQVAYVTAVSDPVAAVAFAEQEVALARTLADPMPLVDALHTWGELSMAAGEWQAAEQRLGEALSQARRLGAEALTVNCRSDLAWCLARHDPPAAAGQLAELIETSPVWRQRPCRHLAQLASRHGAHKAAAPLFGAVERGPHDMGWEKAAYDCDRSVTLEALGSERFEQLRTRGAAMTAEALAEAAAVAAAAIAAGG